MLRDFVYYDDEMAKFVIVQHIEIMSKTSNANHHPRPRENTQKWKNSMVKMVLEIPAEALPILEQIFSSILQEISERRKKAAMPQVCSKKDTSYFDKAQMAAKQALHLMSEGMCQDDAVAWMQQQPPYQMHETALANLKFAAKKEDRRLRAERMAAITAMVRRGMSNSAIARKTGLHLSTAASLASQAKRKEIRP